MTERGEPLFGPRIGEWFHDKWLRQLTSCRVHTGTFGGSARSYVVRIINLQTLLAKLVPELARRLQASPYATWQGNLLIALEESGAVEEVMVTINWGTVTIAPVTETLHFIHGGQDYSGQDYSGQALAQLIVGSEAAEEIVEMNGIALVDLGANKATVNLSAAQW